MDCRGLDIGPTAWESPPVPSCGGDSLSSPNSVAGEDDGEELFRFDEVAHDLFLLIDGSVRRLDPRTEVHNRESYTENFPQCITRDFKTDPQSVLAYYALLGIRPKHWVALKQAFMFAMQTHNPYMAEHDKLETQLRSAVTPVQ